MTTTPDFSWLPVSGRHSVTVGPSLGRALKSRKGGPPPKNNKVPNVDFFSLRYGFQPESIDVSKPGTIEVKRPNEPNGIHVERACAQDENISHVFVGSELSAKDWDCVLVYDHETGNFTLEKLDSYVLLNYDGKADHAPRQAGSPVPAPTPGKASTSASVSTSARASTSALAVRDEPGSEDGEGDLDEEFKKFLPTSPTPKTNGVSRSSTTVTKVPVKVATMPNFGKIKKEPEEKEEGEASEGEIVENKPQDKPRPVSRVPLPGRPKPPPVVLRTPAKPAAVTKAARAKHVLPPPPVSERTVASAVTPKPTPTPAPAPTPVPSKPLPVSALPPATNASASKKRSLDPDVEEFDLPPPAKRARTPPSSTKGSGLSLPGAPLSLPTSAPVGLSFPGMSSTAVSLPPPTAVPAVVDSDDENEWEEIQLPSTAAAPPPAPFLEIEMEEIIPEPSRPLSHSQATDNADDEDPWGAFDEQVNRVGSADPDMDVDGDVDGDVGGDAVAEEEDFLLDAITGDTDDDDTSSDDSDDD